MARNDEVMIQDVDPLNAKIYFNGYMYVGALKMIPQPTYFAPYFRKPHRDDPFPFPSAVASDGISWFSHVFTVRKLAIAVLKQNAHSVADQQLRGHKHWQQWNQGLDQIRDRAINENWHDTDARLYFLLPPQPLGHTITKCGWLARIGHGFGTSLDRLKHSKCMKELKH